MLKTKLGTIFISFSLAYLVVGCAQGGGGSGGSSGNASGDVSLLQNRHSLQTIIFKNYLLLWTLI